MMMTINVLTCLIILTSQCVHSKVINVNSDDGNDSTECCVHGTCICSSLYTALQNIASNTIINITSKSVTLHNATTMGSGKLTNIAITGNNITIMCNDSGNVYCESCDHVSIEGITWDRCGDPNGTNIAGVTFNGISDISLVNCTFQHSQSSAVALLEVSDNILIKDCDFLSNIPIHIGQLGMHYFGILSIVKTQSSEKKVVSNTTITVKILKSYFYNNGYHQNVPNNTVTVLSSLHININKVDNCYIIMENTTFNMCSGNAIGLRFGIPALSPALFPGLVSIQLIEILILNNTAVSGDIAAGINFESVSNAVAFSILSSSFNGNYGGDFYYCKQNIYYN